MSPDFPLPAALGRREAAARPAESTSISFSLFLRILHRGILVAFVAFLLESLLLPFLGIILEVREGTGLNIHE
jgi:hypothetical protein